jgi:hypothetical protein
MGLFELLNESNMNMVQQQHQHQQQDLVQTAVFPPQDAFDWGSYNWNAPQATPSKLYDQSRHEMDLSWMLELESDE